MVQGDLDAQVHEELANVSWNQVENGWVTSKPGRQFHWPDASSTGQLLEPLSGQCHKGVTMKHSIIGTSKF